MHRAGTRYDRHGVTAWAVVLLCSLDGWRFLNFLLLEVEEVTLDEKLQRRAVLPFADPRVKRLESLLLHSTGEDKFSFTCGVVDEGVGDAEVTLQWDADVDVPAKKPTGGRGRRPKPKSVEVLFTSPLRESGLPRPRKDLLLAIPRPSQLERLLPRVAQMGVGHLILCGASKVDANYFRSHVMEPQYLRKFLGLGLAGAEDPMMPKISVEADLQELLKGERLKQIIPGVVSRVVAHPTPLGDDDLSFTSSPDSSRNTQALMAIGPEAGWEESELEMFAAADFRAVSLGPRVLRTEVATVAALALAEQMLIQPAWL